MRKHFTILAAFAALALTALAPTSVAHAQSDPRTEQARQYFTRGLEFIGRGRWHDAIRELQAARAIHATPAVLFNLGLAQRAVGRDQQAIASFREFLRVAGTGADPQRRVEAERYITEMTASIARLHLRLSPPNAVVTVDDQRVPEGSATIQVDPGRHRVRASAPGYEDEVNEVTLEPGGESTLALRLVRSDTRARLHVETNTLESIVRVDGRVRGSGSTDIELAPGHHVVEVRAPGYRPFQREVDIETGGRQNVRADLQRESQSVVQSPWFWVGTTAVVVLGVVGGVLLFGPTEAPHSGGLGVVTTGLEAGR